MSENEYWQFMSEHPEITLSGFRIGRRGYSKEIFELCECLKLEYMRSLHSLFEDCCRYLRQKSRLTRGLELSDLRMDIENWAWPFPSARIDFPLGIVMLAAVHEGYRIRKIRGSYDGRIMSKRREVR